MANSSKTVWIDLLCWRSALKMIALIRRSSVEKIYYANTTVFFQPFIGPLARLVGKPIVQILEIAESEEKIAGISLYESIQLKLEDVLDGWVNASPVAPRIRDFCLKCAFNAEKYKAHLKESAYRHMFRPIEIGILAEKISGRDNSLYLLRRTPFCALLKTVLGDEQVSFYDTYLLGRWSIIKRHAYEYDAMNNDVYFTNKVSSVIEAGIFWLLAFVFGLVTPLFKKTRWGVDNNSIGIELMQSRIRLDEINEIFWLQGSGIDPRRVVALETEDFDEDSVKILTGLGLKRVKLFQNFKKMIKFLLKRGSADRSCDLVFPDAGYGFKTFPFMMQLWLPLIAWNEMNWIRFQEVQYICRTFFWMSIYRQLGIRILWSMPDMDNDKLAKAQALEKLDGLSVSGHWSNIPMYVVLSQKCADVLFTWGEHFLKNNFNRYPFLGILKVGYPSDHYFDKRRSKAVDLRDQYPGKFILSYQDNAMSNDLGCSMGMQVRMHNMLVSILRRHKDVVVFLKPKRQYYFQDIVRKVPGLQDLIDQKRVVLFFGETFRIKAVPAEIGMASDLVIGLSISAAASECFFAGTVAFHADLTGFTRNQFADDGLGKIVFRDIASLEAAVEDRITGRNALTHQDYRPYYETLDPFQDGQAYSRMGFVMKKLQEGLEQGLTREGTVVMSKKIYEESLRSRVAVVGQV